MKDLDELRTHFMVSAKVGEDFIAEPTLYAILLDSEAKAQLNQYASNQVVEELKALEAIIATIDNDGANPPTVFSKVDRMIHTRIATLEATTKEGKDG